MEVDGNDAQSKLTQFTQSLGVCWITLSVLCQMSLNFGERKASLIGLVIFNVLNSAIMYMNAAAMSDLGISLTLVALSLYALMQTFQLPRSKTC